MRFKENQLTPEVYKGAFLHFIDTLAPEVMDRMKILLPAYEQLTDGMSREQVKSVFDCVVTNEPEYINETLFCFDENFRFCADEKPELNETQNKILKNFLEFRCGFYEFIERFGLEKPWLKKHVFDILRHKADHPHLPVNFTFRGYAYWVFKGEPLIFNFDGWYACDTDSKDYKKATMLAFKEHLSNYIKETALQAKARGYTTPKGRPKELEQVEWLVRWTVQKWTMKEITAKYDKSKEKAAIKADILFERKAFAAFDRLEEQYDLPRGYKKHSKTKNL